MFLNKKNWTVLIGIVLILSFTSTVSFASEEQEVHKTSEAYDPLIPQSFVFDKENHIFAGISAVTNSIDLITYNSDNTLSIGKRILVDEYTGRHDEYMIYRPKGIAIYEGHVVYLASNKDSCRFVVLNLKGDIISTFTFGGSAQAFSYSPSAKELYIAGENPATGYDIMVLDASDGFDQLRTLPATVHYRVPKKADETLKQDPSGMVLLIIAMLVVFSCLALLYIVFKLFGNYMIKKQNKKARKYATQKTDTAIEIEVGDVSGDVYAAIATAIFMYQNELHDEEYTVITIDKVSRTYSPWSSKLYGLNTYFKNR